MKRKEIFIVTDIGLPYDADHILQMVTKARQLADQADMSVTAVCIGTEKKEELQQLFCYGTDQVILCRQGEDTQLWHRVNILEQMIADKSPQMVLFPATDYGKAAAAILSTRFEAGLTADCIDISWNEEKDFDFTRAAINDSVIAKIKCINCELRMSTVKFGVFEIKKADHKLEYQVVDFKYADDQGTIFLQEVIEKVKNEVCVDMLKLEKVPKVFCVGRGVKNPKLVSKLFAIGEKCGIQIVGTRAAVEAGLIEKERQVGQSGKSISPQIYVGFGVSGASQHMVGIKNAKVVVAVNQDADAFIFDYADYIIVEDLEKIINELYSLLCEAA